MANTSTNYQSSNASYVLEALVANYRMSKEGALSQDLFLELIESLLNPFLEPSQPEKTARKLADAAAPGSATSKKATSKPAPKALRKPKAVAQSESSRPKAAGVDKVNLRIRIEGKEHPASLNLNADLVAEYDEMASRAALNDAIRGYYKTLPAGMNFTKYVNACLARDLEEMREISKA